MTRAVITPEFIDRTLALRAQDMTIYEISVAMDCGKTTVWRIVGSDEKFRHAWRARYSLVRKMDHDQAREALEMYKQNIGSKVLERHFGCSRTTIHAAVQRLGVEMPRRTSTGSRPYLSEVQMQEIKALVSEGATITKMSKQYRVSRSTIVRSLRRES